MELLDKIRNLEYFKPYESVSYDEIERVEKALNTTFAKDYKECLHAFGAFAVYGHEIKGICSTNRLSVESYTNHYKKELEFDDSYYVIEDIDGYPYVQNKTGKVFYIQNGKLIEIAECLYEYLKQ